MTTIYVYMQCMVYLRLSGVVIYDGVKKYLNVDLGVGFELFLNIGFIAQPHDKHVREICYVQLCGFKLVPVVLCSNERSR